MIHRFWSWLSTRTIAQSARLGLIGALVFEGFTCLFRFGFGLAATQSTSWMAAFTFGFRIHHGYVGLVLLLLALAIGSPGLRRALIIAGVALTVSDLVHHLLVLWPITGSPEFHIRYSDLQQ